jgi:tetratricopeptide (TPR) repeat protein
VPFVADDLAAWLVGLLADASRRKLIALVLGTDQERALLSAATVAVRKAADELCPGDDTQAEHVAGVIGQVFGQPSMGTPAVKHQTLLQSLQAGIASQLAVLDDGDITTEPGFSSADALGIAATVVAETLTSHLLEEIFVRGSRGGPLFPLASQLNDDVTHLQGQRIEDMLGELAGEVREALARLGRTHAEAFSAQPLEPQSAQGLPSVPSPDASPMALHRGKPINECDPLALGVHRAIHLEDDSDTDMALPKYIPRKHDLLLGKIVHDAVRGHSRIAALVGEPSTGKTRACWEAVQQLPPEWRLWPPYDAILPLTAAQMLTDLRSHTVVLLNDAQHYLITSTLDLNERIAAGLRDLLFDESRAPVLILLTIWPEDWATVTSRPLPGQADPYFQARALLTGADIAVPDTFTRVDLEALHQAASNDRRLESAATHADAGRVVQYLAGVPLLLERYRNAPSTARAVIDCAIDARRLGYKSPITRGLIGQAAPGYLADPEWTTAGSQWLEHALDYTGQLCHGTLGPLTYVPPRPGEQKIAPEPYYRLADYLEQAGRSARRGVFPPESFWNAVASAVADTAELRNLAQQAEHRGRYRRAAQLYRRAAELNDTEALRSLAWLMIRADDWDGAHRAAQRAAELGDTRPQEDLAEMRNAGNKRADSQEPPLRFRERQDTRQMGKLAKRREAAGDKSGAETVAVFAADIGDTWPLYELIDSRHATGDKRGAKAAAILGQAHGHDSLRYLAGKQMESATRVKRGTRHIDLDQVDEELLDHFLRDKHLSLLERSSLNIQVRDRAFTEAAAKDAVDRGKSLMLINLGHARGMNDDVAGADDLFVLAANCGDLQALRVMAVLREHVGDSVGAERIRRFGLTDNGLPAVGLE